MKESSYSQTLNVNYNSMYLKHFVKAKKQTTFILLFDFYLISTNRNRTELFKVFIIAIKFHFV